MQKYHAILILFFAVFEASGAALPLPESEALTIERYHSIAMDSKNGPIKRIAYADKLVALQQLTLAAQVYNEILTDPQSNVEVDLDLKLLVVEGLGMCGSLHQGKAILILMQIAVNPNTTDEQKASAKTILDEIQADLK